MAAKISYDEVTVGQELPGISYPVERMNLVMYAGASGDFNPIHWNESFAKMVGLPDVISHGMFNMGSCAKLITNWVGDPAAVRRYKVRFSKPVVVPNEGGNSVSAKAKVVEKLGGKRVAIEISAENAQGDQVISNGLVEVELA
jgi:acyl dehydratase